MNDQYRFRRPSGYVFDTDSSTGTRPTGARVMQEPTDQPYGVRDCAFRDPASNHVRINEVR